LFRALLRCACDLAVAAVVDEAWREWTQGLVAMVPGVNLREHPAAWLNR
jgi:hypothetical protein